MLRVTAQNAAPKNKIQAPIIWLCGLFKKKNIPVINAIIIVGTNLLSIGSRFWNIFVFEINNIIAAGPNMTASALSADAKAVSGNYSFLSNTWYYNKLQ